MKHGRKILVAAFIVAVVMIIAISIINQQRTAQMKEDGEALYVTVQSALGEYPVLNGPYQASVCYYCNGTAEYMLLKNGDRQITGMRTAGEPTVYFMDGKSWTLDETGNLAEIEAAEDPVVDIVGDYIAKLLADKSMEYTYQIARGRDLPLWVYPNEPYLACTRSMHSDKVEVMVCFEDYIRWDIAASTEDVTLYLFASEGRITMSDGGAIQLPGWGEIGEEVYSFILE